MSQNSKKTVLVLGASGYVGGRLVPMLLEQGYRVRAGARKPDKLTCRHYAVHPDFEPVAVDVLDQKSLSSACKDCIAVYYLVHSMGPSPKGQGDFASKDRIAARNMVKAASQSSLRQIIYLGGLGDQGKDLSHHLKSRLEVGEILQSGPVPVTFLKAAMILGAGSASFEVMRYLVERLPVMITPKWVHTKSQPIAITNVLGYLSGCLDHPDTFGQTFEIGGPDVLSYSELFNIYCEEAGLPPRLIVPVPVLSPKLSSYWIHLVTPVPSSIAVPLAEGLRNTVVCHENRIQKIIPQTLLSCREAISRALANVEKEEVDTCWTDAGEVNIPEWVACSDSKYSGGTIYEISFQVKLAAPPEKVWPGIESIGGKKGWYFADFLWRIRGMADKVLGGSGYRAGRRVQNELRYGDTVDFWRVIKVKKFEQLRLLAEMKVPGQAILEFELFPDGQNCLLVQRARFYPKGLLGLAYWNSLTPAHNWLFKGMLEKIALSSGIKIISGPEPAQDSSTTCRL
ncbi:SDR family oxidoreductase [Desulfonatronovibrio magnus]|uniref:SDR family oxidoreductase n=1 Tax=Desulfonatronovibrio magnus TaxID=698827 RepID=UPI0005EACED1|nr:SDR family oxidoreductase [Desulfonatronovibrio magnus]